MEDRGKKIIEACLQEKSKNPIEIFCNIAKQDFIRIHGPEHHILDGAALLTAFYNAGGKIDLKECLYETRIADAGSNLWYVGSLRCSQFHGSSIVHY